MLSVILAHREPLATSMGGNIMHECEPTAAVVGLGKLGLPLACVLACKGLRVHGIDASPDPVAVIDSAEYRGNEPTVSELLWPVP